MPRERTWISREEIAEIHESIADNSLAYPMTGSDMYHAKQHQKAAADIRATDKLNKPVGSRV